MLPAGIILYRKTSYDNFDLNYTKKYILKILRLYVLWSIIYFPLNFKEMLADDKGIIHAFLGYNRNFLMTGSYAQLWYLNSAIVGALVVSISSF